MLTFLVLRVFVCCNLRSSFAYRSWINFECPRCYCLPQNIPLCIFMCVRMKALMSCANEGIDVACENMRINARFYTYYMYVITPSGACTLHTCIYVHTQTQAYIYIYIYIYTHLARFHTNYIYEATHADIHAHIYKRVITFLTICAHTTCIIGYVISWKETDRLTGYLVETLYKDRLTCYMYVQADMLHLCTGWHVTCMYRLTGYMFVQADRLHVCLERKRTVYEWKSLVNMQAPQWRGIQQFRAWSSTHTHTHTRTHTAQIAEFEFDLLNPGAVMVMVTPGNTRGE